MKYLKNIKWLAQLELALIFLVILAGSVVRMTGSGMGCPDWPKCYGLIIPPTQESQVQWQGNSTYSEGQMIVKDEAVFKAKSDFSTTETYNPENWEQYTKHDYAIFNPVHTWIEYINRLASTVAGVPMLLLFLYSWLNFRKNKGIAIWSSIALILLLAEAWLGKLVVDGNLIPNQITIHMLGALLVLVVLVVIIEKTRTAEDSNVPDNIKTLLALLASLFFIQMLLGTQVREQVDAIYKEMNGENRDQWIGMLDIKVLIHRSFSWTSLIMAGWIYYKSKKENFKVDHIKTILILIITLGASGALLYYLALPMLLQPLHLLISSFVLVLLFQSLIRINKVK